MVTETELKRRLETKSALEWGVTTREPSKKELREWENEQATGGLRAPWVAVSRNYGLRRLGLRVRQAFDRLVLKHPQALHIADTFGTENCTAPPAEIIEEYRSLVAKELDAVRIQKPEYEEGVACPVEGEIVDTWLRQAHDTETCIGEWSREGVPLGIDKPIQSCHIFPQSMRRPIFPSTVDAYNMIILFFDF